MDWGRLASQDIAIDRASAGNPSGASRRVTLVGYLCGVFFTDTLNWPVRYNIIISCSYARKLVRTLMGVGSAPSVAEWSLTMHIDNALGLGVDDLCLPRVFP